MSGELKSFQSKSVETWRQELCDTIAVRGTLRSYPRKSLVLKQGDLANEVFAIKSGLVEISGLNASGHEVTTSVRRAGEHFGWAEGLLGVPRGRQATALQDTELWQMPMAEFLNMLLDNPPIMLAALGSAVHREIGFTQMRYDLRGASAYEKVAYVVLRLEEDACARAGPGTAIKITHEEIARICELSRQTVTTVLRTMQKRGIIQQGFRTLHVNNRARLLEDQ